MYSLFSVLLCLFSVNMISFCASAAVPSTDLYKLDIVHYNDFHARFEETSVLYPICHSNDSDCLGGFPRLYHEVMVLLKEKPDALLLNAGDSFQGTYWYTLLKWNITQQFMNLLPHDAHALGNHEFDGAISGLAPYLAALKAPVVAANIDTTEEPALKNLYKPHIIVERNGRKIGIIGLVTPDTATSSNSEGVIFLDPMDTVKREAQALTDEGVDIIIVLSHCGLTVDIEMAEKVGENLDIIVGGHSHSLLWNGASPSNETVSGPYPVVVNSENKPDHKVLVVTASALTKYLGNLTTYFDQEGELQSFEGYPVFLNRSIPEDQSIKDLLKPYKEELEKSINEVVSYNTKDMLESICKEGECELGNLIADAYLSTSKEKYETNLTSIAFLGANMIRGSIPAGEVTRGSVINALPFTNKIVTLVVQGKHLVKTFERCLNMFWTKDPYRGPWVPQVAGIKLSLNATSGRVDSALVNVGGQYTALDPEQDYQVTTSRFLIEKGRSFTELANNSRDVKDVGIDAEIFEKYIQRESPLLPQMDNRVVIVT